MNLHAYVVLNKNGELLAFFDDVEKAYIEFTDNSEAHELIHADCDITDRETLAVLS